MNSPFRTIRAHVPVRIQNLTRLEPSFNAHLRQTAAMLHEMNPVESWPR